MTEAGVIGTPDIFFFKKGQLHRIPLQVSLIKLKLNKPLL